MASVYGLAYTPVVGRPGVWRGATADVLVYLIEDAVLPSRRQSADPKDEFIVASARVADVVALIFGDSPLLEFAAPDLAGLTPAAFLERLESRQ